MHTSQRRPRPTLSATSRALGCLWAMGWLCASCGSPSDAAARDQQAQLDSGAAVASPELKAVGDSLSGLEGRAEHLVSNVRDLERLVVSKASADDASALLTAGHGLFVEVNAEDVIKLNGAAISLRELITYIQTQGKAVCQPQPTVVIDPNANYDAIAEALEAIYMEDCGEVNIVQQNPDRLKGK